jgi:3-dehydroquinate synthase
MLNYGHTIGHAVELASGFELLHGEAVAIGIIAAGMIEIEMGLDDGKQLERVRKMLAGLAVPVKKPANISKSALIDIIRHDKKAINQWPRFVLIDKIGTVHRMEGQWAVEVKQDVVENVLGKL